MKNKSKYKARVFWSTSRQQSLGRWMRRHPGRDMMEYFRAVRFARYGNNHLESKKIQDLNNWNY